MIRFIIVACNDQLKPDINLIILLGYTRMLNYLYSFY
jgi:hypothetical protein